jgi:hypothetical protein
MELKPFAATLLQEVHDDQEGQRRIQSHVGKRQKPRRSIQDQKRGREEVAPGGILQAQRALTNTEENIRHFNRARIIVIVNNRIVNLISGNL